MFVSGIFVGALVLPTNGHSPRLMVATGVGYALLAVWFGLSSKRREARIG